jgi:PKD repeat protein
MRLLSALLLSSLLTLTTWAAPKNSTPAGKATTAEQSRAAVFAGVDDAEFKRACPQNSHLHLDRSGRAFFSCENQPTTAQVGPDTTPYTSTATYPLDQTFKLHTRPGASKVIYLDFTGHTTTGTPWNTNFTAGADIVTPPFDTDGIPSSISDTELAAIQDVWRRVAEDYASWDVDVTTEDPGVEAIRRTSPTDGSYGVRCVIGGSSLQWLGASAGGVAYVGSFTSQISATSTVNDTPAFVFPAQLANNARYVAEAASHEIGHTLGLYHSGQTNGTEYYAGHADWAPIMGVGYYKTVTQWTKGDYPLANNQQDQLNLITGKIARLTDEHGNSSALASIVSGAQLTAGGVISDRTDTDWFKITSGVGTVNVTAAAAAPSANLKIGISLVDASGLVLAQGTANGMGANLSVPVSGGDYYVVVDGIGTGDALTAYTDYSSLGRFSLNGSWPAVGPVNQLPVASTAGSTPTSGAAPLTTQFVGTNSSDPDGIIVSYLWDFGDGASSTLANPSHGYATAGNYTAKLTVTDNSGGSASATLPIVVSVPTVGKIVKVSSIVLQWVKINTSTGNIQGTVTITDGSGKAMPNASVNVTLSGMTTGTFSGATDRRGQLTVKSGKLSSAATGTTTLTVNSVTLAGYTYDPANNTVTSETLTR